MEIYNDADDLQVEYKDGEMPLNMADRVSNNIIVSILKEKYKEYAILSEEEFVKDEKGYNMSKKRIILIDYLKAIAILFVILDHIGIASGGNYTGKSSGSNYWTQTRMVIRMESVNVG